jgi:hypothetical protein
MKMRTSVKTAARKTGKSVEKWVYYSLAIALMAWFWVKDPDILIRIFDFNLGILRQVGDLPYAFAKQISLFLRFINAERWFSIVEVVAVFQLTSLVLQFVFRTLYRVFQR